MSKRNNHKLLAMTALVSAFVAGSPAQALDTAVLVSGAVQAASATIADELLLATDADAGATVTAGDTVATHAAVAAELLAINTGTVITVDTDVTLNIDHAVATTAAGVATIDVTAATGAAASTTINVTGVTVSNAGAGAAINVAAAQQANINLDGATVSSAGATAISLDAATSAATTIDVSGSTITGAVVLSNNGDTVNVSGTSTVGAITGGTGSDTLTSSGTTTAGGVINAVEAINITAGTFDLNAAITNGSSVTVSSGAAFDIVGAGAVTADVTVAGSLTTGAGTTITGDVTVSSGAEVIGDLQLGATNDIVTFANNSTIAGVVATGLGDDTITIGNATSGVDMDIDGEGGTDTLTITPGAGNSVGIATITAVETINIGVGTTDISSGIAGATTVNVVSGATLDVSDTGGGSIAATTLEVSGTLISDADMDFRVTNITLHDGATLTAEELTLNTLGASTLTLENTGAAVTYATSITGGADDELIINGDTNLVTLSGTLTGSDITLGASSTVAMTGTDANTAQLLTLGADSSLRVQGANLTAAGAFTTGAGSTVRVDAGNRLTAATEAWDDDTTWNLGLSWDEATVAASVGGVSLTAAADLSGHTINIMVAPGSDIVSSTADSGVTLTLFTTGGLTVDATTTVVDSAFYDFGLTAGANDLVLDVTQTVTNFASLGTNASNKGILTALQNVDGTASAALQTIYSGVVGQATAAAVNNAVESLLPDMSGGAVTAAINTAVGAGGSVSTRLASLRGTETGMAAGDLTANRGMWVQAFGSTVDQDERDGVKGFDATTAGLAVGVDSDEVVEGARVGAALSYASSDVDSDASSNAQTDIKSFQLTAYGSKDLAGDRFVDAMVGYAFNSYETSRTDFLGNGYNGDFDGNQFLVKVEAGQTMDYGSGMKYTPIVGLSYVNVDTDSYSETGAGGGALRVDSDSNAALFLTVGADLEWDKQGANGIAYKPYLSAKLSYDMIGDEVEATSTFLGGGAAFKSTGADVAQAALDLGAGVNVVTTDDLEINLGYDATIKSDYLAHTGQIRFRWMF